MSISLFSSVLIFISVFNTAPVDEPQFLRLYSLLKLLISLTEPIPLPAWRFLLSMSYEHFQQRWIFTFLPDKLFDLNDY